ncbi:ParM/StbA family protein [Clostridium perfringens]|nr:ParM/StbA family protein [Clostridium perfringens]
MSREQIERVLFEKKGDIIEEKILNIGIDTGFGYKVSYWDNGKLIIPSLCKEISKREALEQSKRIKEENIKNGKQLIVRYKYLEEGLYNSVILNEKYFYVGDITLEKDTKAKRVLTTKRVGNLKHLIQILSLIGIATDEEDINVNLSVGLPVKMNGEAQALKKWLAGKFEISFLCEGKEIIRKINIEHVEVLPQALAPVFSLEEYIGKKIVSVDLGHYTNDMCFWTGRSKREYLDYCEDGFHIYYNEMRKMLLNDTNIIEVTTTISEKDIQEALENGVVNLINGENDVEYHREKILKDYSIRLVEEIVTMYETIFDDIDFILISGGVIENNSFINTFMKEIEKYRMKILMPDEPQLAVAKGLYNLVCKKYNN